MKGVAGVTSWNEGARNLTSAIVTVSAEPLVSVSVTWAAVPTTRRSRDPGRAGGRKGTTCAVGHRCVQGEATRHRNDGKEQDKETCKTIPTRAEIHLGPLPSRDSRARGGRIGIAPPWLSALSSFLRQSQGRCLPIFMRASGMRPDVGSSGQRVPEVQQNSPAVINV